jgi:hypothetical protein
MHALKFVVFNLLMTMSCATFAAAPDTRIDLTVNTNGQAAAGIPVVLELANRGKVSAGATDTQGNVSLPLDLANMGKVQMDVAVEECPNGEKAVVIIGPNGEQKTECKRRKIGVLWWGGSQHATIDLSTGSLHVAQTETANASSLGNTAAVVVQGAYVELGLGMANYGNLEDLCNGGAGNCNADDNVFATQFDVGYVYRGFDVSIGYLYNDQVKVSQTSGDSTSSSSTDVKVDAHGFYFLFGYRIPVFDEFSVIPQVGVLRSTADAEVSFTTTFTSGGQTTSQTTKLPNESDDSSDVMYGIGAAWQLTRQAAVLVNWRHAKVGGQSEGKTDSFLIGGRWSFGAR